MNAVEKEVLEVIEAEVFEDQSLTPSLLEMVAGGDATVNCF